uniref:hypothetical protein n=1 Tax=Tessaracoccus timonensis TaxID=2161816 RepID=UPI00131F17F9|nr:hypothetical protein [Tessaracoccus timonensis]
MTLASAQLEFNAQGKVVVDLKDMPGAVGAFNGSAQPVQFKLDIADGPDRFSG